jgi:hypothetical protein
VGVQVPLSAPSSFQRTYQSIGTQKVVQQKLMLCTVLCTAKGTGWPLERRLSLLSTLPRISPASETSDDDPEYLFQIFSRKIRPAPLTPKSLQNISWVFSKDSRPGGPHSRFTVFPNEGIFMDLIQTLSGEGTGIAKRKQTHVSYELGIFQH